MGIVFRTGLTGLITEFWAKKGVMALMGVRFRWMGKSVICLAAAAALAAASLGSVESASAGGEGKSIEAKIAASKKKNQEMKENMSGLDDQLHKLERELSEINARIESDAGAKPAAEKKPAAD